MGNHRNTRSGRRLTPSGQDTLITIVPMGHLRVNDERDWGEVPERARQEIFLHLATLGISDLQAHLKFELTYTPQSWRKR